MKKTAFSCMLFLFLLPHNLYGYSLRTIDAGQFYYYEDYQLTWEPSIDSFINLGHAGGNDSTVDGSFQVFATDNDPAQGIASIAITRYYTNGVIEDLKNFATINYLYSPPQLPDPITEYINVPLNTVFKDYYNWVFTGIDLSFDTHQQVIDPTLRAIADLRAYYRGYTNYTLVKVSPVPEPCSMLLFSVGLLAMGTTAKKKYNFR